MAAEREIRIARLVAELGELPVAVIGDVMDRFGLVDSTIKPVWPGARLRGQAATIWTREGDNLGLHEYLKQAEPERVVVINGGGMTNRALLGDLIAERALNARLSGFVVDGAVRDVDGIREAGIPVFARAVSAAGPYKDGPFRLGATIQVGGVAVAEGDLIFGDADGVVVVPLAEAETVLTSARRKLAHEDEVRTSLRDARSSRQ